VLVTSVWIFFRALRSLMYIYMFSVSHTQTPSLYIPHTHTRNAQSYPALPTPYCTRVNVYTLAIYHGRLRGAN
jgi:hypothetical protein